MEFKSGFAGLVGPTNSGKSTLLNAIIGKKVSIVSPRPQTTYHGIRGIKHGKNYQLVVTDTPGFQNYREYVPRLLNKVADRHAEENDILVWVFDASNERMFAQIDKLKERISKLKPSEKTICVLNKVDLIPKPSLLPMIEKIHQMNLFSEIIPISAKKDVGVDQLVGLLQNRLTDGQPYYDTTMDTDRSLNFRVTEIVREKIYELTHEEVPYSVLVQMEEIPEAITEQERLPTFYVVIHVDTDSKKGILIGKRGEMLKEIGTRARKDIQELLGKKICLKLHVDVEAKWTEDTRQIQTYLELA